MIPETTSESIEEFKPMFDDIASSQSADLIVTFFDKFCLKSGSLRSDSTVDKLASNLISAIRPSLADIPENLTQDSVIWVIFSYFQRNWNDSILRLFHSLRQMEKNLGFSFLYFLASPMIQGLG